LLETCWNAEVEGHLEEAARRGWTGCAGRRNALNRLLVEARRTHEVNLPEVEEGRP
jgi:hypothetical protein